MCPGVYAGNRTRSKTTYLVDGWEGAVSSDNRSVNPKYATYIEIVHCSFTAPNVYFVQGYIPHTLSRVVAEVASVNVV